MSKIITTKIPGRTDIELVSFYESFEWYYPECELQTKEWVVNNARPDWAYIDCGANIGYYSILFSQLSPAGQVHAIEPTKTVEMLRQNIDYNRCNNIHVHNIAVGNHDGRMVEKVYRIWGTPPEEIEYDFLKIDTLVENLGLKRLDCLKIDVDSFDFEVLKGAEKTLEKFDPWLVIELNHALSLRCQSNMEALSWLQKRGYRNTLVLDHDNFVMRRSATDAEISTNNAMRINFPSL